jgi:DNA-binding transcriptional LysR family regulator
VDLGRLRALRELSQRQTMAAVADALFLTPSAVSQQIAQLEEEAGTKLVERQGRGVRLTRAGEALVAHAERILTVLDEAKSELAQIRQEVSGVLRVAAFPTVAASLLPGTVNMLSRKHPYLEIVMTELEPGEGLAALGSWQADVAFVDDLSLQLGGRQKAVELVHVLDDMLYVLLPRDHPLSGRQSISAAELRDERWALDSASSFYAQFVVNLCRRAGFEPRVNAECRGFEMVWAMVRSGCSITVIPGLRLALPMADELVAVRLRPKIDRRISLAYRRGEQGHPAVQAFVQQVLTAATELHYEPS